MPDELNVITSRPDAQTAMPSHCDNANCVSLPLLLVDPCVNAYAEDQTEHDGARIPDRAQLDTIETQGFDIAISEQS